MPKSQHNEHNEPIFLIWVCSMIILLFVFAILYYQIKDLKSQLEILGNKIDYMASRIGSLEHEINELKERIPEPIHPNNTRISVSEDLKFYDENDIHWLDYNTYLERNDIRHYRLRAVSSSEGCVYKNVCTKINDYELQLSLGLPKIRIPYSLLSDGYHYCWELREMCDYDTVNMDLRVERWDPKPNVDVHFELFNKTMWGE